jgi:hypothetical protein
MSYLLTETVIVSSLPTLVRLNRCGGLDTDPARVCYRAVRVEIERHPHRQSALLSQQPIEPAEQLLRRAGPRQLLAEQPDRLGGNGEVARLLLRHPLGAATAGGLTRSLGTRA